MASLFLCLCPSTLLQATSASRVSHKDASLFCRRLKKHQLQGLPLTSQQQALTVQRSRRSSAVCAEAGFSELAPITAAVYGSLLFGGGLFAYTRSASKGSLFGGLVGGVLLGLVYVLMRSPETKDLGDAIGFGSALLFVAFFGIRLAATRKIVPAAPLLLLSIAASAVFAGAYLQDRVI